MGVTGFGIRWNGMGQDGGDGGQRMMMGCNFVLHLRLRGIRGNSVALRCAVLCRFLSNNDVETHSNLM